MQAKTKKKRYLPWIILSVLFLVAVGAGAIFAGFFDNAPRTSKQTNMLVAADKATVMIMGVDTRKDDVGRSDTLMVATIDPTNNQAAILSIPRDTRVQIPGYGWDKINAAYAYGGYKLTRTTVEQLLDVPMNHYVIINIQGFQKIIDAIGGVDIDVEKRMYYNDPYDDNGGLHINLQPGLQHMDGKTAITYVRYRDSEGDIGRIKRQQKFMLAVMEKVLSPSIIPRIPTIISEVFSCVQTDMSIRQLLAFFGSLRKAQQNGLKTEMVPGTPMYINGISYWIPNITKLRSSVADTLDIDITPTIRQDMEETQVEYQNAIPDNAQTITTPPSSTTEEQPASTEDTNNNSDKSATEKPETKDQNTPETTTEHIKPSPASKHVPKSELQEPSAASVIPENTAPPSRDADTADKT